MRDVLYKVLSHIVLAVTSFTKQSLVFFFRFYWLVSISQLVLCQLVMLLNVFF